MAGNSVAQVPPKGEAQQHHTGKHIHPGRDEWGGGERHGRKQSHGQRPNDDRADVSPHGPDIDRQNRRYR
jgi:hypothetical protein